MPCQKVLNLYLSYLPMQNSYLCMQTRLKCHSTCTCNNANKYKCIVHTLHSCETSYDEPNIMQIINIMFCVKPILTKEWHTKTAEASQWNSNLQLKLISLEPNTFLELGHKNWMSFDQVFSLQLRSRSWNENLEPPWWWLIVRGGRFIGKSSLFMSHGQQKSCFHLMWK